MDTDERGATSRADCARIAKRVTELAAPVAQRLGYTLWDCRFRFEEGSWQLQLEIDRADGGISINDCEAFTHAIDPILDEADPIPQSYLLDVSSPGLERELRTPEQITAMHGAKVELKLRAAIDTGAGPTKTLDGTLDAFDGGNVKITAGDTIYNIPLANIKKMKTVFEM